jgi:multidrug transporter EmrE-like cation transporter
MTVTILILIVVQVLYTTADLMGRMNMKGEGSFSLNNFLSLWFLVYFLIRTVATFGQLYIFSLVPLGKTMALFGAVSIVLSNLLGLLVLKEALSIPTYVGVSLAILAFAILAHK